jgi:hypothetical protein
MQHVAIVAQDTVSAVDKRNDCMAALRELAAKFAAYQPGGTGYENAATGSGHDAFVLLSLGSPRRWLGIHR